MVEITAAADHEQPGMQIALLSGDADRHNAAESTTIKPRNACVLV